MESWVWRCTDSEKSDINFGAFSDKARLAARGSFTAAGVHFNVYKLYHKFRMSQ
jgi:hypothetical protein